ncbi:MAG: metal ABC transporter ATP-binding protein [Turicibacter sp.]
MEVHVNQLSYHYDQQPILKNISFKIGSSDFLVVLGPNGTGKSTLIKCLIGVNKIPDRVIFYDNFDLNVFHKWTAIGYVPQRFEYFNFEIPMTVSELLQTSTVKKVSKKRKLVALHQVNLCSHLESNLKELSGGQLQRVLIARSLLTSPTLLILDEPTVGIDSENLQIFYQTLSHLKEQGVTIILITHDETFLKLPVTHVLRLGYLTHSFTTIDHYKEEVCP